MEYHGCAPSAEKGKGRLCATEVDKQGNLRKWARCNKYCGKDQGMNIISIIFCMTKFFFFLICIGAYVICKAAGQGKRFERAIGVTEDCVFPFIYRGKKHNGCVPSSKNGKGPWCATKVDSNNKMKTNKWARCNKHCDTDKGISFSKFSNNHKCQINCPSIDLERWEFRFHIHIPVLIV